MGGGGGALTGGNILSQHAVPQFEGPAPTCPDPVNSVYWCPRVVCSQLRLLVDTRGRRRPLPLGPRVVCSQSGGYAWAAPAQRQPPPLSTTLTHPHSQSLIITHNHSRLPLTIAHNHSQSLIITHDLPLTITHNHSQSLIITHNHSQSLTRHDFEWFALEKS